METRLITSLFGAQFVRRISTSTCLCGKRNFKKFPIFNKRGTKLFKEQQKKDPHPDVPIYNYGVRPIGMKQNGVFMPIKEMIPEIIVPDLTGFRLKPYVSYRAEDIVHPRLTPEELFGVVYTRKIAEDFAAGKLGPNNEPLEPSAEEMLTLEEARARAMQVNSDIV